MKKAFLFLCLVLFAFWTYALVIGRPLSFNLFATRVLVKQALSDPEYLTQLGIIDNTFLDFHSDTLTDLSPERNVARLKSMQNDLATLQSFDRNALSTENMLTYDALHRFLSDAVHLRGFHFGTFDNTTPYPLNQLDGVQNSLPDFLINAHQITNKKSAEAFLSRLSQCDIKIAQFLNEAALRERNGVIPPRYILQQVIDQASQFSADPPNENYLYNAFKKKIAIPNIAENQRAALCKEPKTS